MDNTSIDTKANTSDVNSSISSLNSQISTLNTSIDTKANTSDVNSSISSLNSQISTLNTSLAGKQPLLKRVVKEFKNITTNNTRGSCSYYTFGSTSNIFGASIENIVSVGIQYWGNISNGMWISMDGNDKLQLWMYGSKGQTIGTLNVYCFYIA